MSKIEVPIGWEVETIDDVCEINPSKSELVDVSDKTLVSFIPMKNVDGKQGLVKIQDEKTLGSVRKGYTYFKNNDVIFAKITPCMENGKIAIVSNLQNGIGFGSTEFHVLRPSNKILAKWIHYFLRNESFRNEAKQNFTGSAGQQRVPKDFMKNYTIPIPKIETQRKIIQKLDKIFGKIEGKKMEIFSLIDKNMNRMNLFQKNWMTYIIDNNIENNMQRKKWNTVTLNDVASKEKNSIVDGPFGSNLLKSDYDSSGQYPVLKISMIYDISRIEFAERINQKKFDEIKRSKIVGGDILIAKIGNTYGITCFYPNDYPIAIIPANMCKITPNKKIILTKFLKYWLDSLTFKRSLDKIVKKSAQPAFGITNFKQLPIPLPLLSVQKNIVKNIETAELKFKLQKIEFENIKEKYKSRIKYIDHIQSSILDTAFSGKLMN